MKVINGLSELKKSSLHLSAVTMGTFDGVHQGHRKIIEILLAVSHQKDLHPVLVTFEPHPQFVLGKRGPIEILTTFDEKLDLLAKTDIETVVVLEFNKQLSSFPPEEFVLDIFIGQMDMKALVIGYDHAFGKNRAGNKELLEEMSKREGFDFTVVPEYRVNGQAIKSTSIREDLKSGDYHLATKALGYNYLISGKIIKGHGIGKTLGFPTINLAVPSGKLLPKEGVYSVIARFDHILYPGMLYIGGRLTFNDSSLSVEVNLFDFKGNIDSGHAIMELIDYIRPPQKFENKEELMERMKNDEFEIRRRYHNQEAVS